jgi:hypothetical protein
MSPSTKLLLSSLLLLSASSIINIACAKDKEITDPIAHGKNAHKNHCYKCHTDEIYTRENRFVKSIDALSKQVVRCKEGSDVPWFDEDADAVVQFLNKKYYKF